jgi:hypothetical protein
MIEFVRITVFALLLTALQALPAQAQPPTMPAASAEEAPPPPAIRRWVDLQHLHLSSRYRWVKASDGRLMSSTVQWQPQVRARLLFDRAQKFSLHVGAFSGSQFISGWNNTGAGLGTFTGAFNVKQLFVSAQPVRGVELEVGSLYMLRGESTEVTSYDNDAYIVGERVTWRPRRGTVTQVAATFGYIGDFRTPNAFERLDRLNDWNYGQFLVGVRLGGRVQASADYTHENGRDILRQGLTVRMPASVKVLSAVKLDAYERLEPQPAAGFNLAADLQPHARVRMTLGVTSIDRRYGPLNADRYELGTRFYSTGSVALTRDVSVGWFQGTAFATSYPIPNQHRFELLLTINPTATLKAHGIF